jgi:tRNA-Thr(GGU) m(6)t(6)A37 methyltransferase TsaA
MQGDEGALEGESGDLPPPPDFHRQWRLGTPGVEILVLTWFRDRSVLEVHPRGDPARPLTGVFSTRSPDRPNPVGLHRVKVLAVEPRRIRVGPLEAIDGTPVIDLKPVLRTDGR